MPHIMTMVPSATAHLRAECIHEHLQGLYGNTIVAHCRWWSQAWVRMEGVTLTSVKRETLLCETQVGPFVWEPAASSHAHLENVVLVALRQKEVQLEHSSRHRSVLWRQLPGLREVEPAPTKFRL